MSVKLCRTYFLLYNVHQNPLDIDTWKLHERRLWSSAILFFHHGEKCWGKLWMFENSQKRTRRANSAMSLSMSGMISFFYKRAGQLKYLLQHNYNTHAAIRSFLDWSQKLSFYPKVFPHGFTREEMGDNFRPESPFEYLWLQYILSFWIITGYGRFGWWSLVHYLGVTYRINSCKLTLGNNHGVLLQNNMVKYEEDNSHIWL